MVIVYTSETGFTQQYAKLLGKSVGIPVIDLTEAVATLEDGRHIFYMGWVMAGGIKDFKKAKRNFQVAGACGVGIRPDLIQMTTSLNKRYKMKEGQMFYLPGGLAPEKLNATYGKALKMVLGVLTKVIQKQPKISKEEERLLEVFEKGGSLLDKSLLLPLEVWIKEYMKEMGEDELPPKQGGR